VITSAQSQWVDVVPITMALQIINVKKGFQKADMHF
jgi:hypothetical protein